MPEADAGLGAEGCPALRVWASPYCAAWLYKCMTRLIQTRAMASVFSAVKTQMLMLIFMTVLL